LISARSERKSIILLYSERERDDAYICSGS
jgi:hypothetical protein